MQNERKDEKLVKLNYRSKSLHVWRHSDIVVGCLNKLLHSGQVMHAAIVSLFTFTTSFDIVNYRLLRIFVGSV